MKRHTRKLYIVICVITILIISAAMIAMFTATNNNYLDKKELSAYTDELTLAINEDRIKTQDDLFNFITSWADSQALEYKVDNYKNIIFDHQASSLKSRVSPTVIVVGYNYETLRSNKKLHSSASMIAKSDLFAGRYTVIFVNDENASGEGYKNLSKSYFKNKAKIIYLDYGKSSYISTSSFAQDISTITIPATTAPVSCDTAIHIKISGINSSEVGTSKQTNTVTAFGSMLSRLKSKSTICQLADFSIESHGTMHPVTLDATILLNSYSLPSFTKYLDKQIESWTKKYEEDEKEDAEEKTSDESLSDGFSYTYEIIDNPEFMPKLAYSNETLEKLTNVLYMIKNGVYKYEATDIIPEGRAAGDTCGINFIIGLKSGFKLNESDLDSTGNLEIKILSQGYDSIYLDKIHSDNKMVAEFFDSTCEIDSETAAFGNSQGTVSRVLLTTYKKVNDRTGTDSILNMESDNYFTPCSYLDEISDGTDIVHLRLNSNKLYTLTNAIICYIATKGNLLSL